MTEILAGLQLATICGVAYFEHQRRSVSVFMWATLILMFGLPHFVSVLLGIYGYSSTVMNEASLFVILFNVVYFVSRLFVLGLYHRPESPLGMLSHSKQCSVSMLGSKDLKTIRILLVSLLAAIIAITGIAIAEFGSILDASWVGFYAIPDSLYDLQLSSGLVKTIVVHLVFAAGGVIVAFFLIGKPVAAMLAATLPVCYALITRNKIGILPTCVALIWWYILRHKRIRVKQVVLLFMAAVLVIYSVYGLQVFRYSGSGFDFLRRHDLASFNRQVFEMILGGSGEIALRDAFYRFLEMENQFPGFGEGRTYVRLLLMLVPTRFSLGVKPPDFAITMGSAYSGNPHNVSYSMHPTLYGDCYANLSWYGVLLGAFWAIAVLIGDRASQTGGLVIRIAAVVLLGSIYVIVARGSVYNGYFLGLIAGLFLGVLRIIVAVGRHGNEPFRRRRFDPVAHGTLSGRRCCGISVDEQKEGLI